MFQHIHFGIILAVCGVFTLWGTEDVPKGESMKAETWSLECWRVRLLSDLNEEKRTWKVTEIKSCCVCKTCVKTLSLNGILQWAEFAPQRCAVTSVWTDYDVGFINPEATEDRTGLQTREFLEFWSGLKRLQRKLKAMTSRIRLLACEIKTLRT